MSRVIQVEKHYNYHEAAALLGMARNTIRRLVRERDIAPVIHTRRLVIIPASSLQRYLDLRKVS